MHEFSEYIDESEPASPQNLTPKKSQSHQPTCTPSISRLFSKLIFCIGTGLFLSIISYNGTFHFWRYPLSNLGSLKTVNGNINIWARSFFDLTMIVAGLYMFRISRLFSSDQNPNFSGIKAIMTSMSSLGFFILLTPYDLSNIIHEIGAALVFGTLWGLTILFSIELFKSAFKKKAILSQIILQVTVLPYAYLFAIHFRVEDILQKFAVAGLIYALWLSTRVDNPGDDTTTVS